MNANRKNIVTVIIELKVQDWEFVFPTDTSHVACWNFTRQWMKFIRSSSRVFECGDKVSLRGVFSSDEYFQDGVEATTSTITRMEKICLPGEKASVNPLKSWLLWPKSINQNQTFRLTTENGSTFTLRFQDASAKTYYQLWVARFGAPDEITFHRALA
ncbi:hypothetical protein IIY68_02955 [Candidatus Saccharibacteria bacterium]|nr:hypothetical protein [Candidatus Saccharibacteria bacterium]